MVLIPVITLIFVCRGYLFVIKSLNWCNLYIRCFIAKSLNLPQAVTELHLTELHLWASVRGCNGQINVTRRTCFCWTSGPLPQRDYLEIYFLLSCHVYRCFVQCLNQSVLCTQLCYALIVMATTVYVFQEWWKLVQIAKLDNNISSVVQNRPYGWFTLHGKRIGTGTGNGTESNGS